MIHRLDIADPGAGADAPVQLLWATVGLVLFAAVLLVVRDHRLLSRYAYILMLVGLVLLAIPALLPGERITTELVAYLRELKDSGARLHGASDPEFRTVFVLTR